MSNEDDRMAAKDLLTGMGIDPDRLTPVSKAEAMQLHQNPQPGDMARIDDPSRSEDQSREFVSNGMMVEKGRVLHDTQQDRFMAIRAVDEARQWVWVVEVVPEGNPEDGDFDAVDDPQEYQFIWPEEGGRYIPV